MNLAAAERRPATDPERSADSWIALCYHDVRPEAAPAGGGPDHFTVPLASFECMLDTIAERGFFGCSLAQAFAHPGRRRVAITFDDGNSGQFEHALPALLSRGMTATFYVTTEWVGTPGFMSWDELRHMVACGMSVQSHTATHPFLSELDVESLRAELVESKRKLDAELSQDTAEIAFPGGDPPASALRFMIREAGYRTAVGTRWGTNADGVMRITPRPFVRRCTARGEITADMARRVVDADPLLRLRWTAKEGALRRLRRMLGASRYARWRRQFLDTVAR